MAQHVLDPAEFRTLYPQFADETLYPDATLQMWWTLASIAMDTVDNCVLSGDALQQAIYMLMAHIGTIMTRTAEGQTAVGPVSSATIDKVTVAHAVPPFKNGWQAYLSQTPYGMQLWALLEAAAAGGFYIGGRPESSSIRKVGGRW